MMKIIFIFSLALLFISCSSSVTDPKVDEPNGTGLSYRPQITMYNFKGGESFQAGGTYKINFKVTDEVMGVNENVIEFKKDSDSEWTLIRDKVLTRSNDLSQVLWNIPASLSGNNFKLRITAYGKIPAIKQIESITTFTIDGIFPTMSVGGFTSAPFPTYNPFYFFKFVSVSGDEDDLSGIGNYCLGSSPNVIDKEDSCWVKKSLTSTLLPIYSGMLGQTFETYFHIRDEAGNARVNTNTPGTDKLSIVQTSVTVPLSHDAFYKASSSADSTRHLGLTTQNTSSSFNYSNFPSNSTQSIDPGLIVYLPSGSILIRDRIKGLRQIDLVRVCGTEPCSSILVGTAANGVDGLLNGVAKLVEPLRMHWSHTGVLWILDRKAAASNELVIRKIDFNVAPPQLVTLIGGGNSEEDSIVSASELKINYSEGLVFYGAFQSLPNGWLVFHSTNPEAGINTPSQGRYKLRIFKASEAQKIHTLYLDSKAVFDISQNPGKDLIATGSPAITFDESHQDIKNIYLRSCELSLPVASGQSCTNSKILGFDKTGLAQPALQMTNFVIGGNFILDSPNGTDVYAKSGISSEMRKYDFIANNWDVIVGNGSYGNDYCLNGVSNSSCSLRLRDSFYDPSQRLIFVMDHVKVRIVAPDVNKIYSLVE